MSETGWAVRSQIHFTIESHTSGRETVIDGYTQHCSVRVADPPESTSPLLLYEVACPSSTAATNELPILSPPFLRVPSPARFGRLASGQASPSHWPAHLCCLGSLHLIGSRRWRPRVPLMLVSYWARHVSLLSLASPHSRRIVLMRG